MSSPDEVVVAGPVPPMSCCSLCSTTYPEPPPSPPPQQPLDAEEGQGQGQGGDWKSLVFEALCSHLQVKEVWSSVLASNLLTSTMTSFHLCPDCLNYGWKLVILDQNLATLLTEIQSLAEAFRNIIVTSAPPVTSPTTEVNPTPDYVQQFITKVMERGAVTEGEEEETEGDDLPGDPSPNPEQEQEETEEEEEGQGQQENVPFQEDEFGLLENVVTLELDLPDPEDSIPSASTDNNNLGGNAPLGSGSGLDSRQDQVTVEEVECQNVGVQEYVTIGGDEEQGVGSPSPAFSPISVGQEGDGDEGEGESGQESAEDNQQETRHSGRQRHPSSAYDDFRHLHLDMEPLFRPPRSSSATKNKEVEQPKKVRRGRGRPKRVIPDPLKQAKLESTLLTFNPASKSIQNVNKKPGKKVVAAVTLTTATALKGTSGTSNNKKIQQRLKLKGLPGSLPALIPLPPVKRGYIKKGPNPPGKRPQKRERNPPESNQGPPPIPLDSGFMGNLPPRDREGYEVMCGMGTPFKRVEVRVTPCDQEGSGSGSGGSGSGSSLPQELRPCYVRLPYDDLFDVLVPEGNSGLKLWKPKPKGKPRTGSCARDVGVAFSTSTRSGSGSGSSNSQSQGTNSNSSSSRDNVKRKQSSRRRKRNTRYRDEEEELQQSSNHDLDLGIDHEIDFDLQPSRKRRRNPVKTKKEGKQEIVQEQEHEDVEVAEDDFGINPDPDLPFLDDDLIPISPNVTVTQVPNAEMDPDSEGEEESSQNHHILTPLSPPSSYPNDKNNSLEQGENNIACQLTIQNKTTPTTDQDQEEEEEEQPPHLLPESNDGSYPSTPHGSSPKGSNSSDVDVEGDGDPSPRPPNLSPFYTPPQQRSLALS